MKLAHAGALKITAEELILGRPDKATAEVLK